MPQGKLTAWDGQPGLCSQFSTQCCEILGESCVARFLI